MEIGLEDGKIPNRAFSASSKWDKYHRANRARLNSVATKRYRGGWSARKNNKRQWIQVRLSRRTRITGLATQGRQDIHQWVTSYSISHSFNGRSFRPYKENGRVKVTNWGICFTVQFLVQNATLYLQPRRTNRQIICCQSLFDKKIYCLFEESHSRISSTNSKVRATLRSLINTTTGKHCPVAFI